MPDEFFCQSCRIIPVLVDGEVCDLCAQKTRPAPAVVEFPQEPEHEVPCMDCGATTRVTAFTWELAQKFAKELNRRGEAKLQRREIARCPKCQAQKREADRDATANDLHEYQDATKRLRGKRGIPFDHPDVLRVLAGPFGPQLREYVINPLKNKPREDSDGGMD